MAQSHNTTNGSWAAAAARCGYAIHNGQPMIGISGNDVGFIVAVPAPTYFGEIDDEGLQENVFRAVAAHALRVGQAKVKASKAPSKDDAAAGVASAVSGTYKPSKDRNNDILDAEANRLFAAHVRERVMAVKPDATQANVNDTVVKQLERPEGKAKLAEFRAQVAETGTYSPRSNNAAGGGAVDVSL